MAESVSKAMAMPATGVFFRYTVVRIAIVSTPPLSPRKSPPGTVGGAG